jgi:hypothetical protein
MNAPTYKISGLERRKVKKELGELKRHVRYFWYYNQLDKDMTSFYGGTENYSVSDDEAQKRFDKAKEKIQVIEEKLSVLA